MESFLHNLSIMLVPILLAVTCHEVSHGFVADRFGDNTARSMGRLTLNPLKHIDLFGTIIFPLLCLMLGGVILGWAKPVPVNFNNLRQPKRSMIWVSAAGPFTNFTLAIASVLLLSGLLRIEAANNPTLLMFLRPLSGMLIFSIQINLLLGLFNLIPILPLDGGRMLAGLLPLRQSIAYSRTERYGILILLALVFLPSILPIPNVLNYIFVLVELIQNFLAAYLLPVNITKTQFI